MIDAASIPPRKPKLNGIDALRGIAALSVLLYHAARHVHAAHHMPVLMGIFQAGHAGVDLFFVLSGFLILHVHGGDVGRPERLRHYARQRFTRVIPLYWIALTLTIAKLAAGSEGLPDMEAVVRSFLLLPGWEPPLLGPAWSLQHELLFYLAFAVLICHRRAGLALLGVWGAFVALGLGGLWDDRVPFQFAGHYNLEFFMGMAVALLLPKLRRGGLLLGAGLTLFAFAGLTEAMGWLDGLGPLARFCYGIPSALLIAGAAVLSRRPNGLGVPRPLAMLGDASYSIYLFQFLFMGVAVKLWQVAGLDRPELALGLFGLMALVGVAGGLLMTGLVEKPLLRLMRGGGRKGTEPVSLKTIRMER